MSSPTPLSVPVQRAAQIGRTREGVYGLLQEIKHKFTHENT
jgi:hypothetical protein